MTDTLPFPLPSWRRSLPRIGLSETSDLPLRRLAQLLVQAGDRMSAADVYREIIESAPSDVEALELLAGVLPRLGRDEEAVAVRRQIAGIHADGLGITAADRDVVMAFELASYGIGEAPATAPAVFVTACFDALADEFDSRLRTSLHYVGPEQVVLRIARTWGAGNGTLDVCDAGCGTGLLGPLLRPYAKRLDGIDLSPRMLNKARARSVYDALIEADVASALARTPDTYDVVTAADVFVCIGDLSPVLRAIALALRAGGLLVFTVERADGEVPVFTEAARYSHSIAYVRRAAEEAGLVEVSIEEGVLRQERAYEVISLTCAFCKPG